MNDTPLPEALEHVRTELMAAVLRDHAYRTRRRRRAVRSFAIALAVVVIGCGIAWAAGLRPFESASVGAPTLDSLLTDHQRTSSAFDRSIPWAARAVGVESVEASVHDGQICLNGADQANSGIPMSRCIDRLQSAGDLETIDTNGRSAFTYGELGLVTDNVSRVIWHTAKGDVSSTPRDDLVTWRSPTVVVPARCSQTVPFTLRTTTGKPIRGRRSVCGAFGTRNGVINWDRPTSVTVVLRSGRRLSVGRSLSVQAPSPMPAPAMTSAPPTFTATSRLARIVPLSPVTHGAPRYERPILPVERALHIRFNAVRTSLGTYCYILDDVGGCSDAPGAGDEVGLDGQGSDHLYGIVADDVTKIEVEDTAGTQPAQIVDDIAWWRAPAAHPTVQASAEIVTLASGRTYTLSSP